MRKPKFREAKYLAIIPKLGIEGIQDPNLGFSDSISHTLDPEATAACNFM